MDNTLNDKASGKWLNVPFIATVTRLLCRELILNIFVNHLVIFGLNRLRYVVDCYGSFYNERRPHQGIGNKIPAKYHMAGQRGGSSLMNSSVRRVLRKDLLGGLLKSYSRNAA